MDAITALDDTLAHPDAPFAVRQIERLPASTRDLIAASSSRYRSLRTEHLARQHKLEALTAFDREKDVAILEKELSIAEKEREINSKDAEITALKAVCDERERLILQQDGHIKQFQRSLANTEARLASARDDKAQFQHALAQLPPETAKAAETLANQSVHIRNIEALVFLRDQEIVSLRAALAGR